MIYFQNVSYLYLKIDMIQELDDGIYNVLSFSSDSILVSPVSQPQLPTQTGIDHGMALWVTHLISARFLVYPESMM